MFEKRFLVFLLAEENLSNLKDESRSKNNTRIQRRGDRKGQRKEKGHGHGEKEKREERNNMGTLNELTDDKEMGKGRESDPGKNKDKKR